MTPAAAAELDLAVRDIVDSGPVRTLTLAAAGTLDGVGTSLPGSSLPGYVPGSHLVVDCGGRPNAYSLLDDGVAPETYRISVLHRPDGGGGSRWLHQRRVGEAVRASPPRSAFAPVAAATHHLLIAGGIGVTPLMSHVRAAHRWGRPYTLLYRYRVAAHVAELRAMCGPRLVELPDRGTFSGQLAAALVGQPLGTHLYVCGPAAFTDLVLDSAQAAGWPAVRLHAERFTADVLDAGRPFRVRVGAASYDVPAGVSLLEALERNGHSLPFRCRQGVCGECLVPVRAGRVEHRDLYLSEAEKTSGDQLLPCVSRGLDDLLEVVV
ncbi:PDR/VanB family oxidoreductase [uncultured Jatrophihabitans sp.]|uniref:PDR/VanB family oxidoreductase n=1 Tax=uncultured Jatrophihabitans sp. TaxID=1610747 RepID=UPI0035CC6FEF